MLTPHHLRKCNQPAHQWEMETKDRSMNNHGTVTSTEGDDGTYIKVCSVTGSVVTEGRQLGTDSNLKSHQQCTTRPQKAVSVIMVLWCSGSNHHHFLFYPKNKYIFSAAPSLFYCCFTKARFYIINNLGIPWQTIQIMVWSFLSPTMGGKLINHP